MSLKPHSFLKWIDTGVYELSVLAELEVNERITDAGRPVLNNGNYYLEIKAAGNGGGTPVAKKVSGTHRITHATPFKVVTTIIRDDVDKRGSVTNNSADADPTA